MVKVAGFVVVAIMVIGCGAEVKTSKYLGERANTGRNYFGERGFTSEEIGGKMASTDDNIGEMANKSRQHFSDRSISGEGISDKAKVYGDAVADKYVQVRSHVGHSANKTREYLYERGVREMKSGDSAKGSESRVTSTEDKLKALEQVVGLHAFLLEVQANSLAELSEDMTVADADLQAQIIAAIESADAALSAQNAVLQAEIDSLSAALLTQGSDITAINAHLVVVDKRIKRLKRASRLHKSQIAHLKQRLNWEIAKRKMKDNYLKGLITALDNELSSVENNLQGQINSLSADLSAVESALGSIGDVQAAIDQAIADYAAGDQQCAVGTQSKSITVPYQYDGDCGHGIGICDEDDFDYNRVITFTVPSVSCT